MPLEIFAFQRVAVDPRSDLLKDEFVFVCSVFDLTLYPVDDPDPVSPSYFRKSVVDIVVATQGMADEFWNEIKAEVCTLVRAMNDMDVLVEAEDFVCGTETESEELDSEDSQ